MNWKKSLRMAGLVTALTLSLVGCNTQGSYSPQEIIDQALQETTETTTYYGEYTMDMGELGGKAQVKEWAKEGKRRIEMTSENGEHFISVNNGSQLITYDVVGNTVHKMNYSEGAFDGLQSPRDQAEILFKMMKDTHDITVAGEEKIAGRDTYRIVAKSKKADTLLGDMEVWIDKKTWLTLKTTTNNAGNKMTTEYSKLDVDTKIDDAQFTLDIPDGATVEEMSEEDYASETVTLDVAKAQLGEFLMVPEADGLTLQTISLDKGFEERPEFTFEYVKEEVQQFSVSVFKVDAKHAEIGNIQGEKEIEVRGQKGTVMEDEKFRYVGWQENGYQYGIIIENPELTIDDILTSAQQMTIVQ
ncbi:LolA family protein [Lysinibacillus sp. NPDC048646]|uniref:LolA family protein n=1 Tax=Lysinibacillus sp. NPDC048646 TaxID=3390574 RepID=UPI003D014568